jgi:hypothetical protein
MRGISALSLLFALVAMTACSDNPRDKGVPAGQISAKMINNPRSASGSSPEDLKRLPVLSFVDTLHDFGTISAGETVEYDFAFTNTGGTPLLIVGASSSCGCTIPQFPTAPLAPGEKGNIKVRFNSEGKQGHILKAVTVNTNANPATRYLTITAEVKP